MGRGGIERDACGVGLISHLQGRCSRELVEDALEILRRLRHRGAVGADSETGDGAGILLQIPRRFFESRLPHLRRPWSVGTVFLPRDEGPRAVCERVLEDIAREEGSPVIGRRDVPIVSRELGRLARATAPHIRQVFLEGEDEGRLYRVRKRTENSIRERRIEAFCFAGLSSRTIVYKALILPERLTAFYPDLGDADFESSIALVHSRFSTNTFPTWALVQPFRMTCHNGEINTIEGNRTWMRAREPLLGAFRDLAPVLAPGASDSAQLDNMLELLVRGGRSLPHGVLLMMPEAWENDAEIPADLRAFYEYGEGVLEPWDGPAAIAFTDGRLAGAALDRNGLRPARYVVTRDHRFILASEVGVLDVAPERILEKGRLKPGELIVVDPERGLLRNTEIKREISAALPYRRWLEERALRWEDLRAEVVPGPYSQEDLGRLQRAFGYTEEDLRLLLEPMAETGEEPIGSMGADTPLAVLSAHAPSLFHYFHQRFAQVTNPPIDPIRESLVMSLRTALGPAADPLADSPAHAERLDFPGPIIRNQELAALQSYRAHVLAALFDRDTGLSRAVEGLCREASRAVKEGCRILVLSDRGVDGERAPIPALLATAAVHHHLIREGKRLGVGLVIETGEAREVHHAALLLGYGALAVNPYLALETVGRASEERWIHGVEKGIRKVMSKMGISTLRSYRGAQIFEAVGLNLDLVARHFPGTPSKVGGIGLAELEREAWARHARGKDDELPVGGEYRWRRRGEVHLWNPATVAKLQAATKTGDPALYEEYARSAREEEGRRATLHGLLEFRKGEPVPLDEVEEASEIVRRFATGAMSFGSISAEAHETLARAMNRIGARSNSGEGGEEPHRYGTDRQSAIKQVASARFGVNAEYLIRADELQIKIAQGAKPGEGGQLPGHKVDERIARVRFSTPGVTLISPPPHHDIYSIEDLAQLIYDLKIVNPRARVSVKLVSAAGVGTVAAGVAKAGAGCIVIAGWNGGTGASPLFDQARRTSLGAGPRGDATDPCRERAPRSG